MPSYDIEIEEELGRSIKIYRCPKSRILVSR